MTVLVTGASGHLGEALVRELGRKGENVRGVDVLPSAFTSDVGSITDREFVRRCLTGVRAGCYSAECAC